jgi:hypothetical protein
MAAKKQAKSSNKPAPAGKPFLGWTFPITEELTRARDGRCQLG